jgi:rod shape-determining protein MreD
MIAGRAAKLIAVSFALAFVLSALPMPDWAQAWRPAWVPMVLMYWCINQPSVIGVFTGFILGLFLDALTGSLLGQHAAALSLAAAVALKLQAPLYRWPSWMQAVVILLLVFMYQLMASWIRVVVGTPPRGELLWKSAVSSMVLWPWLVAVLRGQWAVRTRDPD